MRSTYNSVLLLAGLGASCVSTDRSKPECFPVVSGGTWSSMQVGFRYRVTESSDATLVGQVFEDSEEETPPSLEAPWSFIVDQRSLYGYLSDSAINQIQEKVCREYFGGELSIPSDGGLRFLRCTEYPGINEFWLWLGVAELNEEGNPCRLYGHLRISWEGEHHLIELESTVVYGGDSLGCDVINGFQTTQLSCPVSP